MLFSDKKAISPIIAVVLLVIITVTLGALVMAIVRTYISQGEADIDVSDEAIRCGRDVSIGFVLLDGEYMICNGTNPDDNDLSNLNMVIENTGTADIDDAQVRIIGTNGNLINNSIFNQTLKMGGLVTVNMTFDPEVIGEFRQVKLVPRINLPGLTEHAFCSDSGVTVENVPNNCSTYR